MTVLTKSQITARENIVVSQARNFAALIGTDTAASRILTEAMDQAVSRTIRPLILCNELVELLGEEKMDALPMVGSGPDNNNPDRYVKGYKKKTGEPLYGSFFDWFAEYLPCFDVYHRRSEAIKAAENDAPIPAGHEDLGNMKPAQISGERRTLGKRKSALRDAVRKSVSFYQMGEKLAEYDTIEVSFATVTGKDGTESINEKTTNPVILKERFWKKDSEGKIVETVVDGETVRFPIYTSNEKHLSPDEYIKLEPETAAAMEGGFSFDNLMKARAARLKREREEADEEARADAKSKWQPYDCFTAIENVLGYLDIDNGGEAEERHLMHIRQVMDRDDTRMDQVMRAALIFDILYGEYKPRWERWSKEQRAAVDGADKKRTGTEG